MSLFSNVSFAEEIADEMERLESHAYEQEQTENDRTKTEALKLIAAAAEDLELAGLKSQADVLINVLEKIANLPGRACPVPPNPGKNPEEKETWRMYGYSADDKNMAHDKHVYDHNCRCSECLRHEDIIEAKIKKEKHNDKNKASDARPYMSYPGELEYVPEDEDGSFERELEDAEKLYDRDLHNEDKYRGTHEESQDEIDAFEEALRENAESYE